MALKSVKKEEFDDELENKSLDIQPLTLPSEPQEADGQWIKLEGGFEIRVTDQFEDQPLPEIKQEVVPEQSSSSRPLSAILPLVETFSLDDLKIRRSEVLKIRDPPAKTNNPAGAKKSLGLLADFVHKCQFCVSRFTEADHRLREHTKRHALQGCDQCSDKFFTENERDWHRQRRHGEKATPGIKLGLLYVCRFCHVRFRSMEQSFDHIESCHMDYIWRDLPQLGQSIVYGHGYEPPCRNHAGLPAKKMKMSPADSPPQTGSKDSTFYCKLCSFLVSGDTHIQSHKLWHARITTTQHQNQPLRVRRFTCELCPWKKFASQQQSFLHIMRQHQADLDPNSDPLECVVCKGKHPKDLKSHILQRHTIKWLQRCQFCPVELPQDNHFTTHQRVEHGLVKCYPLNTVTSRVKSSENPTLKSEKYE